MSDTILECKDLTKSYSKGFRVLDGLDMTVQGGKIVGLLGPNGCGKSTLLKLIAGLLTPDCGSIKICGTERSEKTNSLISYLPERTYFTPEMKVDSLIEMFSSFYADFDETVARQMMRDLGIPTNLPLKKLSKGTKEKVQLILVMSRKAKLYMLDEPIGGVDPAARDYILNTIINNYSPDSAVIITTHLIYDIEPIIDDFYFMGNHGEIKLSGVADDVREKTGKSLEVLFKEVFSCSPKC